MYVYFVNVITNYFNIPINKYKYGRLGKNKTNHGAGRI